LYWLPAHDAFCDFEEVCVAVLAVAEMSAGDRGVGERVSKADETQLGFFWLQGIGGVRDC